MLIDRVSDVLVAQLGVDRARLVGTARLDEDLDLDSLALTEAMLALEDELVISIPDAVQARLSTFADLLDVVAAQVAGGSWPTPPSPPPPAVCAPRVALG